MLRVSPSPAGVAAQRLESLNVDLSLDELKKFAGKSKVQRDEALQVYTEMSKVRTIDDFLGLFQGEVSGASHASSGSVWHVLPDCVRQASGSH